MRTPGSSTILFAEPTYLPSQCGVGIVPIALNTASNAGGQVTSIAYDGTGNLWISAYFGGSEVNAPPPRALAMAGSQRSSG